MSYYVIIRGTLGIGKSTIAKKLAGLLNGEYISIDGVLEKYALDKTNEECIPAKNFIKANELVLPEINEKLNKNKIMIFDGNFYHKKQIEHLIQNLHTSHYVFTLKAPLEVCIERDSKRENAYGKESATAVYNLVSRFNYGILIDTENKTVNQVVKKILSFLPKAEK